MINAVIDTNVLVAAMRSRTGASFRIVELALQGVFRLHCSVPLFMEYEEILTRNTNLTADARAIFLSALLTRLNQHEIYFLFRGVLPDDDDAMILELAIKSQSIIVTHNTKDFTPAKNYGIDVQEPRDFLHLLQQTP